MPDTVPTAGARAQAKAKRRIAIFGGYGSGNFGNDASFEALYNYLRAELPDAEVSAVCSDPNVVTERYGARAIAILKRPRGIWRKLDTLLLRQPSTWSNWIASLPSFQGTIWDFGRER